jgi:hypothetical protein
LGNIYEPTRIDLKPYEGLFYFALTNKPLKKSSFSILEQRFSELEKNKMLLLLIAIMIPFISLPLNLIVISLQPSKSLNSDALTIVDVFFL